MTYFFFLSSFNLIIHKRLIKHPNGRNVLVDRRTSGKSGSKDLDRSYKEKYKATDFDKSDLLNNLQLPERKYSQKGI